MNDPKKSVSFDVEGDAFFEDREDNGLVGVIVFQVFFGYWV